MKQVLTQQEIDELLNALNTGDIDATKVEEEVEKDKVKSYDFRRPIKLSKEYVNSLHMIFENFSKIAGNLMSTQIRNNINVKVGAIEQLSYDEFIKSIPRTTLMSVFKTNEMPGFQVLEINPLFCNQVIDLMCGGGEVKNAKDKKDKFTDIELGILEEVIISVLKGYEIAWKDVMELSTEIEFMETNPQMVQNMSPNEPVILITFTVDLFGQTSFMNICIPYMSFEDVIEKLSFKNWFDFQKQGESNDKELIEGKLMSAKVDIEVILGKSIITVDDFMKMEEGDILELDVKTSEPLTMYIEDKLHYLVKPGLVKGKVGVEILEYIEEGVEYER